MVRYGNASKLLKLLQILSSTMVPLNTHNHIQMIRRLSILNDILFELNSLKILLVSRRMKQKYLNMLSIYFYYNNKQE